MPSDVLLRVFRCRYANINLLAVRVTPMRTTICLVLQNLYTAAWHFWIVAASSTVGCDSVDNSVVMYAL